MGVEEQSSLRGGGAEFPAEWRGKAPCGLEGQSFLRAENFLRSIVLSNHPGACNVLEFRNSLMELCRWSYADETSFTQIFTPAKCGQARRSTTSTCTCVYCRQSRSISAIGEK